MKRNSRRPSSCQSQSTQSFHQSEDRIAPSIRPFCPGHEANTESESENIPTQHCAYSYLTPFMNTKLREIPFLTSKTTNVVRAANLVFSSCLHVLPYCCSCPSSARSYSPSRTPGEQGRRPRQAMQTG